MLGQHLVDIMLVVGYGHITIVALEKLLHHQTCNLTCTFQSIHQHQFKLQVDYWVPKGYQKVIIEVPVVLVKFMSSYSRHKLNI
jgi:hypothetical protein